MSGHSNEDSHHLSSPFLVIVQSLGRGGGRVHGEYAWRCGEGGDLDRFTSSILMTPLLF